MKISLKLSLVFLLILVLGVGRVSAQEDSPIGPQYVVRAGDTLSSIALRFDVSMQEIIDASQLSDPDALNVGDVLVLPGIDWIDGVLVFEDLPYGESFFSLQRHYLLSAENLARLNRLTSPNQLYVGFSTLLATERGEFNAAARALAAPGSSLLEIAAANGDNPWSIAAVNQLPGTWAAVPGDVLFTPGRQEPGPGGLPSPISALNVEAPAFVQGKTAVINIHSLDEIILGGELVENDLHFFPSAEGVWTALQGVPLETDPGTYGFSISGNLEGAPFAFSQAVRVQSGNYERETLTVDPEFLDQDLSAAESAQVRPLMSEATPEKHWQGLWGWPHPYVDVINSEYGVARSYNGGSYQNYHYGVDFGGGVGIEIWAPVPGKVVFAGPLEVRGNATIINHGWGIYTGYWHQSEILVSAGDFVEPGQLIGLVGETGRVSGAHLHWEIWVNGVPVEPMDWLNQVYP